MIELITATSSDVIRALVRSATSKSFPYHSVVNPCQAKLSRWFGALLKV